MRLYKRGKRSSSTPSKNTTIDQNLRDRLEFYTSERIAPVIRKFLVGVRSQHSLHFDECVGEGTVDLIFSAFPCLPNLALIAFQGMSFTRCRLQILNALDLKAIVIDHCFSPSGQIDISSLGLNSLQLTRLTANVEFKCDSMETLQVDGLELSILQPGIPFPLLRTLSAPLSHITTFLTQHDCPSLSSITTHGSHQSEHPSTLPLIPLRSFTGPAFLAAILFNASGSRLSNVDIYSCDHHCSQRCDLRQSLLQFSQCASMQLVSLTVRSPDMTHMAWLAICTFERLQDLRIFTEPKPDWEVSTSLRSIGLHLSSVVHSFLSFLTDVCGQSYPTAIPSHSLCAGSHYRCPSLWIQPQTCQRRRINGTPLSKAPLRQFLDILLDH
jgi:hypothetical protein